MHIKQKLQRKQLPTSHIFGKGYWCHSIMREYFFGDAQEFVTPKDTDYKDSPHSKLTLNTDLDQHVSPLLSPGFVPGLLSSGRMYSYSLSRFVFPADLQAHA